MSTNPAVNKATTVLSEDMDKATTAFVPVTTNTEPEPTATDAKGETSKGTLFRLKLLLDGRVIGSLGRDSEYWAKLVSGESALTLEEINHNGANYLRIYGTDWYMSVSDRAYVGFYNWSGATGFTRDRTKLKSNYNGQYLSYDSKENGYLTCWDSYARLDYAIF